MKPSRSRVKSCYRCRHLKIRCDRERRFPQSCTRCAGRQLSCVAEPSTDDPSVRVSGQTSATFSSTISEPPSSHGGAGVDQFRLHTESFTLGEIQRIFAQYFAELHLHFPILDPSLNPVECISGSPALFWTIITVTMKIINRDRFERLQPQLRALISTIAGSGFQGLAECQALCLLCAWPLDTVEGRGGDNTQLYAQMAYAIATERGFHRPSFPHEYQYVEDPRPGHQGTVAARSRTWCAVYLIEHHVTSRAGLPSSAREDHATQQMLRTVDSTLQLQCQLAMIRTRYLEAIAFQGPSEHGLAPPQQRLALLKLFSADVQTYLRSVPEEAVVSRLVGLYTLLSIGGFCLAGDLPAQLDATMLPLIHEGLTSAKAIADLITPLKWETLPVHAHRCLVYAAIYVVQLGRSRFGLTPGYCDVEPFVDRVLSILLPLAFGRDYATRSRTVLRLYNKHSNPQHERQITAVLCQSRMGANIYWDLFHSEEGSHRWTIDRDQLWADLMATMPTD